jgi:hypothetical protein
LFCRGIVPAEALDGSKDVIGGFGPSERFGICVVSFDERGDACPEGGYAATDAAPDLLIGEDREEALHLVEPGRTGQVHVPAWPFHQPSLDQRRLVRGVIIHDQVNVELGRHACFDLVEELAELSGAVAPIALANDPSGRNIEGGEQRLIIAQYQGMASAFCRAARGSRLQRGRRQS